MAIKIKHNKIAIIIPAYNEDQNIEKLINRINHYLINPNIFVIDDSTNFKTHDIIRKKKIKINYFHRNKKSGRGSAVIFALRKIIKNKNIKVVVEMDADFSHPPKEIVRNLNYFLKNDLDLLIGSRYLKRSKIINWPMSRKILSYLSNKLAKLLLSIPVSDYTNGFRIYSIRSCKVIIKRCGKIGDGFIILSEILQEINNNRLRIDEIETVFVNRARGESSINLKLIVMSLFGLIKLFIKRFK